MAESTKSTNQKPAEPVPDQNVPVIESEPASQNAGTLESEQRENVDQEPESAVATVRRVAFCLALNLRSAPGIKSAVLCVLPEGSKVVINPLEWVADGTAVWFPAVVDELSGYVNGQYLAVEE